MSGKNIMKGIMVTNMKKFASIAMAALMLTGCLGLFSSCGNKEEGKTSDTVKDIAGAKEEFIIGITIFEPMNYYDKDGELTGFETEFAKAVCEKVGVEPKFQVIDWKTKETELNTGNIDCIWNGMTIDDDRKETMCLSDPYMKNMQVLVVKDENVEKYSDKANLDGITIVAESESAGETVATTDEIFANSKYVAVEAQSNTLLEVKSGSADGALLDYIAANGMIGEDTDYSDLKIVDAYNFSEEEYGIAFRKGDTETKDKFQKVIDELMNDGTVDKIAEKYDLDTLLIKK